MKLALGAGLAAAALLCFGLSVSVPKVEAATTNCTVTTVKNFKGACPAGMKFAGGSTGNIGVLPEPAPAATNVTPTSGPAACVKTNVHNLKNSCNAAS
ncbi:MAG: hypothetical protein U1E67_00080 [Hyphomicrobiales bacterium]